jgi:hypothetical protein
MARSSEFTRTQHSGASRSTCVRSTPRRRVGDNFIDLLLSPRERLEATQFPGYVGQHVVEDVVHDDDGFSKDPDRSTTTAGT